MERHIVYNGSSSCLAVIMWFFCMAAWLWHLPTPLGNVELDLFPPALRIEQTK